MTLESLKFLRELVGGQQISANHPELVQVAGLLLRARNELDAAIKEAEQ